MPDLIPSILIDADKPRSLRFGAGAVVRLERAYNKPITQILQDLQDQARLKQMRVGLLLEILVAGFQHEDKGLTAEELADSLANRYGREWLPQLATMVPQIGQAVSVSAWWIYDRIHNGTIHVSKDPETGMFLFPEKPTTLEKFKDLKAGKLQNLRF